MKPEITNNDIFKAISDFRNEIRGCYVSNDRFMPVEKLVYGMVGVILLAVGGALVALVVSKTGIQATW